MPDEINTDVETRSAVDLKKCGAARYFEDSTTDVLLGAFQMPDGREILWQRGEDCPADVAYHIRSGGLIPAWNAYFEWLGFKHVLGPRYGFPVPKIEQMRDTMAQAAACSIPQALDRAAEALNLDARKDKEGTRLIRKFSVPRRARKGEIPGGLYWNEPEDHPEDFARFGVYCIGDTRVEKAARRRLMPLSDAEQAIWEHTVAFNDRGVMLDLDLIQALQKIAEQAKADLNRRMAIVTGGAVMAGSQVANLTAWLQSRGVPAESLAKAAIEELLSLEDLPEDAQEAIEIRKDYAKTSTAKLDAMLACRCKDGRARGLHLYHGAGTGRWAGKLIQCVTGDHEILTREGWKRIDSVVGEAEIMAWSPISRRMSWQTGTIGKFPAPAQLAKVESPAIRGRYTLDHRIPNVLCGLEDWTPEKLLTVKRRDGFLVSAPVDQPDYGASDDEVRLLVAMQADGNSRKRTSVFRFSKQRKIDRLEGILDRLDLPYEKVTHPCDPDITQFNVHAKIPKGFGPWVLLLSERQANLAFDELAHWDGFRHQRNGSVCLMSPDKEQVEWMATLAALAGRQVSLNWYRDAKSPKGRWSLYERASRSTTIRSSGVNVVPNQDPVYCPTVPGGYWLCRYQDHIYITGNTQNMPRGTGTVKNPERARAHMILGRADAVEMLYGSPMRAVSDMLRACIVASPGNRLMVADYSSIEGRVTAWLAGEAWKVAAFEAYDRGEGPGMYELTAGEILSKKPDAITKDERQAYGKVPELALGYQGGVMAFDSMAKIYGVEMSRAFAPLQMACDPDIWAKAEKWYEKCKPSGKFGTGQLSYETWMASDVTKRLWRAKHPATVALWEGLEDAAVRAVQSRGSIEAYGRISYLVKRGFLWCRLPSGRCLAYGSPRVEDRVWFNYEDGSTETVSPAEADRLESLGLGKRGQPTRGAVTALGVDSTTKQWRRFAVYGGLATENVVQAIARDIMANGMLQAEAAGYPIVMTVHDEAVADVPVGHGSQAAYEGLLCALPGWADGLPLVASGYEAHHYRKD